MDKKASAWIKILTLLVGIASCIIALLAWQGVYDVPIITPLINSIFKKTPATESKVEVKITETKSNNQSLPYGNVQEEIPDLKIDARASNGEVFTAGETGIYKFTIISGNYRTSSEIRRSIIKAYVGRDILWGDWEGKLHPLDEDYVLGCWEKSMKDNPNCGIGNSTSIHLQAGQSVRWITMDEKGTFGDNDGEIIISIEMAPNNTDDELSQEVIPTPKDCITDRKPFRTQEPIGTEATYVFCPIGEIEYSIQVDDLVTALELECPGQGKRNVKIWKDEEESKNEQLPTYRSERFISEPGCRVLVSILTNDGENIGYTIKQEVVGP